MDLKAKYNLTLHDFNAMLAEQQGRCAICGVGDRKLVVDHHHATGRVRRLLCDACNTMIGYAREDPAILLAGAAYLRARDSGCGGFRSAAGGDARRAIDTIAVHRAQARPHACILPAMGHMLLASMADQRRLAAPSAHPAVLGAIAHRPMGLRRIWVGLSGCACSLSWWLLWVPHLHWSSTAIPPGATEYITPAVVAVFATWALMYSLLSRQQYAVQDHDGTDGV